MSGSGAEWRRDLATGAWTLVAPERRSPPAHRPQPVDAACPLCDAAALEVLDRTGPETFAVAHAWPALRVERPWQEGLADRVPALGAHEVLVEDSHDPAGRDRRRLRDHLELLERRVDDLRGDLRLKAFVWVRDQGGGLCRPGEHPHGQLFALPVELALPPLPGEVPALALWRVGQARAVVAAAPRTDHEVWILPGRVEETAEVLGRVLGALDQVLGGPPVSCAWTRAARGGGGHLVVVPRLRGPSALDLVPFGVAGLSSEEVAEALRSAAG